MEECTNSPTPGGNEHKKMEFIHTNSPTPGGNEHKIQVLTSPMPGGNEHITI